MELIDLNDVQEAQRRFDLAAIRERLSATASNWLPGLFPNGIISRNQTSLRCADLTGRAPRNDGSCVFWLSGPRAGWAYDFATGESAGPIEASSRIRPYGAMTLAPLLLSNVQAECRR